MGAGVAEEVLLRVTGQRPESLARKFLDLPRGPRPAAEVQPLDRAPDPDVHGERGRVPQAEQQGAIRDLLADPGDLQQALPGGLERHAGEPGELDASVRDEARGGPDVRRAVPQETGGEHPGPRRREAVGGGKREGALPERRAEGAAEPVDRRADLRNVVVRGDDERDEDFPRVLGQDPDPAGAREHPGDDRVGRERRLDAGNPPGRRRNPEVLGQPRAPPRCVGRDQPELPAVLAQAEDVPADHSHRHRAPARTALPPPAEGLARLERTREVQGVPSGEKRRHRQISLRSIASTTNCDQVSS